MSRSKIVVTGANGQVGKELRCSAHAFPRFDYTFLSKEDLSLDHYETVERFFDKEKPQYCINCAAYTAVDKAETEKELAFLVNGKSVGVLANACHLAGTRLFHLSTDYVFDGHSSIPWKEEDSPHPLNVYGASKLLGEQLATKHNADTLILRTSWVYSEFGNNFVKTMLRLMNEKKVLGVVVDQWGSPTYAADLSHLILQLIEGDKFFPGIYHYSNEGEISWYDFAVTIKELIQSECIVNPIPTSAYPVRAIRPAYSVLDKTKIEKVYQVQILDWKMSLSRCIAALNRSGG